MCRRMVNPVTEGVMYAVLHHGFVSAQLQITERPQISLSAVLTQCISSQAPPLSCNRKQRLPSPTICYNLLLPKTTLCFTSVLSSVQCSPTPLGGSTTPSNTTP